MSEDAMRAALAAVWAVAADYHEGRGHEPSVWWACSMSVCLNLREALELWRPIFEWETREVYAVRDDTAHETQR